jgi:glycyl-tRNA synthetase alpha subunit
MSVRITTFNKILLETLGELSNKFPQDRDIFYALSELEIAQNTVSSTRYVVTSFMESLSPFKKEIEEFNESFFLNLVCTDENLKCFNLADKWQFFSVTERAKLFATVQKLLKLGAVIESE